MAKKKEEVNLSDIDANFVIASFNIRQKKQN